MKKLKIKDIIKNKKARAVPVIAILIVVLVIAVGIVIYIIPGIIGSKPYWETENEFGDWGTEIILEYNDGSTESLKMLFDNPALEMYYDGKEINGLYYQLSGKATEGTSSLEVDFTTYQYSLELWQGSTRKHSHITRLDDFVSSPKSLPVDGSWHLLIDNHNTLDQMGASSPEGTYTFKIVPSGALKYRASGGSWITALMPSTIEFTVVIEEVDPSGSIIVSFSHGFTYH